MVRKVRNVPVSAASSPVRTSTSSQMTASVELPRTCRCASRGATGQRRDRPVRPRSTALARSEVCEARRRARRHLPGGFELDQVAGRGAARAVDDADVGHTDSGVDQGQYLRQSMDRDRAARATSDVQHRHPRFVAVDVVQVRRSASAAAGVDAGFLALLGGDRRRRLGQRVVATAGLREGDDLAQRGAPGSSMVTRSQPKAIPPCGGAPKENASSRKPNFSLACSRSAPSPRTPAAGCRRGGYGSIRRRFRCHCRRCRRRRRAPTRGRCRSSPATPALAARRRRRSRWCDSLLL